MACLDPLIAFRDITDQYVNKKGKDCCRITILSKSRSYLGMDARSYRDELCRRIPNRIEALDLPCGQCFECRLAQSRDWANRLILEAKTAKSALFLTFTYDDEHLPKSELGFPTLKPEDLRAFNKALTQYLYRKYRKKSPRYFECGEYGSQTLRPHYHSIHFNLNPKLLDLTFYKSNWRGDPFYKSEVLSKLWGKGFVVVGECNWDTCAYVARYVCKKLTGDANDQRFDRTGKVQEFVRMSNRPGLASQWLFDHSHHVYRDNRGYIYVPSKKFGKAKTPRYFDKLFSTIDDPLLQEVLCERSTKAIEEHFDLLDKNCWDEVQFREAMRAHSEVKKRALRRRSKEV